MKKSIFLLSAITMIFLMFQVGCASVGRKVDPSNVEKIKKGETTKQEVLNLLGSPDRMTRDGNGYITMVYSYARATSKPASFIPIIGPLVGGTNVQTQSVIVFIGPTGVVTNVISTYGTTETDVGLSSGSKADIPDVEQDKRPK
jgi:outer membrane protein assembly factor BamE (lipoprotein component of BamABCDE complex)